MEWDVCIVGYGPVGATLANLLADVRAYGSRSRAGADIYLLPRAVHFDDECMRLFQTIGLAESILPHTHVSPGMRFVDAEGRLILELAAPAGDRSRSAGTPATAFTSQNSNKFCASAVTAGRTLTVRLRAEVFALDQDDDGVAHPLRGSFDRRTTCRPGALCGRLRWRPLAGAPPDRLAAGGSRLPRALAGGRRDS